MTPWADFPSDYRQEEVKAILGALRAGESVGLVGLSGAGKSNLLGYLAHRYASPAHPLTLVDCNRLLEHSPRALLHLTRRCLGETGPAAADPLEAWEALHAAIAQQLETAETVSLLFDRLDLFAADRGLLSALRALRDEHKFRLAYVIATRRPLPIDNELAELLHAHTLWLGALDDSDARWNVARYAARRGERWAEPVVRAILDLSLGYPSLLKATCEAVASGAAPDRLAEHPAVQARVAEFWDSEPEEEQLAASGLADHPLLLSGRGPLVDETELTAKERLLYDYFQAHASEVCAKDQLIRAVWPEDAIYEEGVRDSSLAQLVRRLRLKIEPDPAEPRFIETVPGRGYLYRPSPLPGNWLSSCSCNSPKT